MIRWRVGRKVPTHIYTVGGHNDDHPLIYAPFNPELAARVVRLLNDDEEREEVRHERRVPRRRG